MNYFGEAMNKGDKKNGKELDEDLLGHLRYIEEILENLKTASNSPALATPNYCPIDGRFEIVKSTEFYRVTYRGKTVWEVSGNRLKHDIYGGQTPNVDCDVGLSTSEMFGIRCGWKKDLFIGFGIKRESGRVVGLQVLYFFPHDWEMKITVNGTNQFRILYGRNSDLRKVLCWNSFRPDTWSFSKEIRTGRWEPCSIERQENTSQFFIPIDGLPFYEDDDGEPVLADEAEHKLSKADTERRRSSAVK